MELFDVYPAIDLRHGRVVRLTQGDPERETAYASDPREVARRWLEAGARWLHVVNLDAALGEDDAANRAWLPALLDLAARYGARLQWGGGVRTYEALDDLLRLGVHRVMVGSMALKRPLDLSRGLDTWGASRIVLSLDARGGKVRIAGWREETGVSPLDLADFWNDRGVRFFLYTDVARDGTLQGPDVDTAVAIARRTRAHVLLAGGVAHLEHVRQARDAGLAGVVIGRALYEGTLRLTDALRIASRRQTADSRQQAADSRRQTAVSRPPTADR